MIDSFVGAFEALLSLASGKELGPASRISRVGMPNERCDNKVYQYYRALRHPFVKDPITKALANRFPDR